MTAVHGGDLTGIARDFGCDAASLLDFSANVNPLGPPAALARVLREAADDVASLSSYPDPRARALVEHIAARESVAEDTVVVANGGAALLGAAVRALAPRTCVLPVPAFSEYAHALGACGAQIVPVRLRADEGFALDRERLVDAVSASNADLCILSNPHNPSGRGESTDAIADLAAALVRRNCALIVDEAFVDYAPQLSLLQRVHALPDRSVLLRSLTKFFAIPGMRVGYGFAPAPLADRMRSTLPSWPVGTLEQRVATAVLGDRAYEQRTLTSNLAARAELVRELRALGCRVFEPAANFIFCDLRAWTPDASVLRARLIREHGIVIRTFEREPSLNDGAYVRLAVRLPHENARLLAAFASIRKDSRT